MEFTVIACVGRTCTEDYSTRDEAVRFALRTKRITETGTETATCKVLPPGNNFVIRTVCARVCARFICCFSQPSDLHAFSPDGHRTHGFAPTAVLYGGLCRKGHG
jgi:hypothetical protein